MLNLTRLTLDRLLDMLASSGERDYPGCLCKLGSFWQTSGSNLLYLTPSVTCLSFTGQGLNGRTAAATGQAFRGNLLERRICPQPAYGLLLEKRCLSAKLVI